MSPKNRDQTRTLQEKVKQALSDAGLLLENGSVEAAISRGYYAVFQAARAAPTVIGDDVFVGIKALILKGVTVAGGGRRRQRRRDAGRAASHRSGEESGPGRVEALREFSQPTASTTTRLRKKSAEEKQGATQRPALPKIIHQPITP
jgi:hypothetical protein